MENAHVHPPQTRMDRSFFRSTLCPVRTPEQLAQSRYVSSGFTVDPHFSLCPAHNLFLSLRPANSSAESSVSQFRTGSVLFFIFIR